MSRKNRKLQEHSDAKSQLAFALQKLMSESVTDCIENMPEQVVQLAHELHKVQTEQQQLTNNFESMKQLLGKMVADSKLLENASKANQCLTNEHYQQHIIEPMACSLFATLDLIEDAQQSVSEQTGNELNDSITAQLLQFFAGYEIVAIRHEQNSVFDPKIMTPVDIVSTQDKGLDGRIAKSLQSGFRWKNQKLLRAESVSLYKFETVNVNFSQKGGVK